MSQFQILKVFGRWFPGAAGEFLGIGLFTAVLLLLILFPFFDPDSQKGKRARTATYVAIALLFGLILTTMWGYWEV
jgi:cytochrome b6